ncbi:MFS transporter [Nocardioides dongxiaopingii]|nr:MFS transporter [Nocardioides sp. S-1144]
MARRRGRQARRARRGRVAPVVVTLGVVSLLTDISSESVAAVLPLYLTAVVGLSPAAYGVVDSLYQGVGALVRVAGGWAADRGGHPKWVALAGYGISCVARLALLVSAGLATVATVIAVDRVGKGIRTAPRDAMISAASAPEDLGHAFGVHRALDTTGAVLGPLIAFALLWWIPDGYTVVLVVSAGFAVLGLALLGLLVDEPRPASQAAPPATAEPFRWRTLANPRLRRLLLVTGGLGLLTVGDGFVYLALLDRGEFAAHWFPLLYVGTNVAYLALAVPLGQLADRVGRARVVVLGHAALVGGYACAAVPLPGAHATIAALVLLGTFYAATDGVLAALAGRLVPDSMRASGIASAQTTVAVARMLSSTLFGLLWFALGPGVALIAVGAVLVVALPVALVMLRGLDEAGDGCAA